MSPANEGSVLRGKTLQPGLARRVIPRFQSGFYEDAVLTAFKVVEERLRTIMDVQEVGVDLVRIAFSPTGGLLSDPNAWPAEREGVHLLFRGAFLAFRNTSAHRFIDMNSESAFDLIILANRLLILVEELNQRQTRVLPTRLDVPIVQYGGSVNVPMMLDTDNDGTTEMVILKPGRHLQDVLPYGEGNLADSNQPIAIYRSARAELEPAEMEPLDVDVLWTLDDVLLADVDGDGLNEVLCALNGLGTQGAYLLVYKYQHGRYEVLRGSSGGHPDRQTSDPQLAVYMNGIVADVDGDERLEIVGHSKPGPLTPSIVPSGHPAEAFGQIRLTWKWDKFLGLFRIVRTEVAVFGDRGWNNPVWELVSSP